jgi:hypothetical protein
VILGNWQEIEDNNNSLSLSNPKPSHLTIWFVLFCALSREVIELAELQKCTEKQVFSKLFTKTTFSSECNRFFVNIQKSIQSWHSQKKRGILMPLFFIYLGLVGD